MPTRKLTPAIGHWLLALGLAILFSGSPNAAPIQSFEPAAAIDVGLAAISDEEFIKAANIFEQAVLAHPDHVALNRHLGIGYYKTGRHEQAVKQLNKTLALSPGDAESHYALGLVYLARASEVGVFKVRSVLKLSIEHLETAIELQPAHTAAHYYLIQILVNAPGMVGGDHQRGVELNQKLAELSPLHHQMVNSTLALQAKEFTKAEELLLKGFQKYPDSSLVNFNMLSHYAETQQWDKAIKHGKRFLSVPKSWDDKSLAEAHHLLANAHWQQGDRENSLRHYALTLTHTSNPKLIAQVRKEIIKIEQ